ncbi:conserved hypothetical protein [Candidatus Nitrosotenuis uzonensis]|uniref:Shikimate kinase n=1 Tax=Candidatus Nitrosotenuis uzonensis TaxID=1407055 RepID=V6ARW0_9ARCH|nr:conserved hypothetical protein [Candidatus Nitrosotenuis uzonensis]
MIKCVLVITGNPGVGKHTLARNLASKLRVEIVDLNKIAVESKAFKKSGGTLDVDTAQLAKIVKKIRIQNAIVVGHLAPYVIPRSQVKFALILRKNPYKLIAIYKKRKYTKRKAIENAGSEILGVILYDAVKSFGAKKTAQIDTTNISIKQMTQKALLILGKKSGGDNVDWLEIVAKKRDLARFFPQ